MSIAVTASGCGTAASGSNFTIPFTAVSGRSLVVIPNNESVVNDISGLTDSGGNTWVTEYSGTFGGGIGRHVFRCVTVGTAPTWVKTSGSSGTIHYVVVEATGMDSGTIESVASYADTGTTTAHIATFNAASSNAMAIVQVISGVDYGTITPTSGFTEIPTSRNARAAFFKADLGASGTKTLTYGSSGVTVAVDHLIAVYKAAVSDPLVSTVSNESTVEGGTNTHTITLSGPTNRPNTPYSIALAGVTATGGGVDFTSALASLTFGSSGVTFDGTQLLVPNTVTTFPIVVATVDDLLDEASETYTLTVGGTAGTGTITDNDAPPVVTFTDGVESFGVVTCVATLAQASGKTITFDYSTANGAKTAGTHYTSATGTLTFNPGETVKTITANTL